MAHAAEAGVITYATATQMIAGGSFTIGYNDVNLGPATQTSGACPATGSGVTCSITSSGTMSSNPNLTSSFDSVSMMATQAANPGFNPFLSDTGFATANADLLAGTMSVTAGGNYLDCRLGCSGQFGASGIAVASVTDTITFTVDGASSNTVTDVTAIFTVNPSLMVLTAAGDSGGDLEAQLSIGGCSVTDHVNSGHSSNPSINPTSYTPYLLAPSNTPGCASSSVNPLGIVLQPSSFAMTGVFAITGPTATISLTGLLDAANCAYGTNCAGSGVLSLDLPGNVTCTSTSDVCTAQAPSVPEPGTARLLVAGMTLVFLGNKWIVQLIRERRNSRMAAMYRSSTDPRFP